MSLLWTGMFAGAFVGATYGAAAGALFGFITGFMALESNMNVDVIGLFVLLVVAGAIAATIWGAMLGTVVGAPLGLLAGIGNDGVLRRLPIISAIVSMLITIGITTLTAGAWSAMRAASLPETTSIAPRLIGVFLTATAGGLGGFRLGRGLCRIKSERADLG